MQRDLSKYFLDCLIYELYELRFDPNRLAEDKWWTRQHPSPVNTAIHTGQNTMEACGSNSATVTWGYKEQSLKLDGFAVTVVAEFEN